MTPDKLLFLLLLSLIPPSCALTEYIGDNVTVAAESVQPCHLFGDSDLFGLGVRASFYVSWAAGLIGFFVGALEEMKAPRLSFNILLLTITIILIRNTIRGSFALLEWYIVTALAFLSSTSLLMMPMQPYELVEDEGKNNNQRTDNSSPQHPLPGNEGPGEGRERSQPDDLTNNQKPATNGDTQLLPNTKRSLAEEKTRRDAEGRADKIIKAGSRRGPPTLLTPLKVGYYTLKVGYYTDPLGLGFLLLLYGIISCCLPWLYFIKPSSGHKEGCAVLSGTWDMYNKHWQGILKFVAVVGVLLGAFYTVVGFYMVFKGVKLRKTYASTLELIKERRYSGIKLFWLDVDSFKRALKSQQPATVTPAQLQAAIRQYATAIQWAQSREAAAARDENRALGLVNLASELQNRYQKQRVVGWAFRGGVSVVLAVTGAISIWSIERTITKNHIDMDDDIASSSGQLLALLVAVLTTANFLWEVFKLQREKRDVRKEAEEIVDHIRKTASSLNLQAARQKAFWQSFADYLPSAWQHSPSAVPPSSSSAVIISPPNTTGPRRGGSVFGSFFGSSPRDRRGDSVV